MRFDRIGAIAAGLILAGVALGLRLYRFEWPHTSALDALQAGTLPPGLHWDEAYNTLAALRLWREGGFEPFIRIDLGRMPLHIYLTTLIFALFGPITVGGRMAALIPGLLNLLIIGVLARAPFRDNLSETEQRNLAWLVTGQMAVTYWFVHTSRIGMEHSTMAFYSTLALIALWWAVRAPTFGRAGLAGAVLGLSIYTYPAAYVLPIAALGILAHHALTQRPPRPVRLRFALAYALGFCLVLLPFILFFIRYPEWVLDRPSGVRVAPAMIGPNVINALTGFVWRGDYNTSYNLRDRPFFDPFQAALFLLGVAICLRRIRQSAYAFGLIWFGVMLLPQVFSEAPHFARNAGATVPAVFIAAIGGAAVWRWVEARARSAVLPAVAFSGLTLVSAGLTARDYFIRWPQVPDYLPTFRAAERLEAELALQAPREPVRYLSPIDSGIPTVRFILDDHPETQVESFNGRECTVLPPVERGARYFITAYEDTRTLGWLRHASRFRSKLGHGRLANDGAPLRVGYLAVSGNYFTVLGMRASAGRLLSPDDDMPGSANVVVSQGFWKNRLGSDVTIVGRRIWLGSRADVRAITPAVLQAIKSLDPEQPVYDVRTIDDVLARSAAQRRTLRPDRPPDPAR